MTINRCDGEVGGRHRAQERKQRYTRFSSERLASRVYCIRSDMLVGDFGGRWYHCVQVIQSGTLVIDPTISGCRLESSLSDRREGASEDLVILIYNGTVETEGWVKVVRLVFMRGWPGLTIAGGQSDSTGNLEGVFLGGKNNEEERICETVRGAVVCWCCELVEDDVQDGDGCMGGEGDIGVIRLNNWLNVSGVENGMGGIGRMWGIGGKSYTTSHSKTPYTLLTGKTPSISHFKPFGCHVTILNTSDHLGKFNGKADEGYLVGYSTSNRAYRVYNMANKRVEETINLRFLEEKVNIQGIGHEWSFDLDYLTDSLGYNRDKANQTADLEIMNPQPGVFSSSSYDVILVQILNKVEQSTLSLYPRGLQGSQSYIWTSSRAPRAEVTKEISSWNKLYVDDNILVSTKKPGVENLTKYWQRDPEEFDLDSVGSATTPYEATKPKSNEEHDKILGKQDRNPQLWMSVLGRRFDLMANARSKQLWATTRPLKLSI
ncbi:putative ribonuclease H-like domain-containing protein [Tanacetum coccineum]